MKKGILFTIVLCMFAQKGIASCDIADAQWKAKKYELAMANYEKCAYAQNDAVAQYELAMHYLNENEHLEQDILHALFLLRLSSESGYAPAQRELGKLMDILHSFGEVGTNAMHDMEKQMLLYGLSDDLSPFAWVLLASEKVENKWFYPTPGELDEQAVQLSDAWSMQKGPLARTEALRQAGAWKESRLLKSAKQMLSEEDYGDFEAIMTSKETGQTIRMERRQAMEKLKQIWEKKRKHK